MRVRKGLQVAWGRRVKGEPSGFDDIDSDEESLLAMELKEQARELRQRRKVEPEASINRFVLVKDDDCLGKCWEHRDLTRAYGVLGPKSSTM